MISGSAPQEKSIACSWRLVFIIAIPTSDRQRMDVISANCGAGIYY